MPEKRFKIWHDDERPAPDDSWIRVHTNAEAMDLLRKLDVEEISCDYILRSFEESGFTLTKEMIEARVVPDKVTFHTSSYDAAYECIGILKDAGYIATHDPLPIYTGRPT